MRTASRWFSRRAQQLFLFPSNSSPTICLQRTVHNVASTLNVHRLPPHFSSCTARYLHTDIAVSTTSITTTDEPTIAPAIDEPQTKKPAELSRWMRQLNSYLPADVRISLSDEPSLADIALPLNPNRLEKILVQAKAQEKTDILLWLVDNGHRKTAVWLMETILNYPSSKKRTAALKSPSNIDWPQDLFESVRHSAIDLPPVVCPRSESLPNESDFEQDHLDGQYARSGRRLLTRVWVTLGVLVIRSAAAGKGDTMDDNMLTALLVLGHIHNLGLMPDDVYTYNHIHQPTFLQRPPILNLVSSRILTALSDVAWRQQQDDAIVQAARMGMSLKEISKRVPGGRFRLRVRPLAPEIWLELILWCCIESDQITAALAIVRSLAAQSEEPWFAISWTSTQSREGLSALIDWDRMKLRHGGPGGLIEGYSREKPFVDVPEKTISVEVILALVEKLIAFSLSSSLTNDDESVTSIHKEFRPLRERMTDIEDVLTFLEPHALPIGYFDYLETRLLQNDAFDVIRTPVDLYTWSSRMRSIRDLEKIDAERSLQQTLGVEEIYAHSQLHIGLQHQIMTTFVQFGDVHNTLAIFNEIQESVDKKKVTSITDFLQQQPMSMGSASNLQPNHELEFTNCHGQLPYHRLAGLLNLISDTKLIGLGRWLLYADDVDGAVLPEQARSQPCMTAALYKFAAVSQDAALLQSVMHKKHYYEWRPTVKMLRARFNASITLLDFDDARKVLRHLRVAQGGGCGLSNIVHVAATILRLENSSSEVQEQNASNIGLAMSMLNNIFNGLYNSTRSDFTLAQRLLFNQQIHCILNVFLFLDGSILQTFARSYDHMYPRSNLPLLPANEFNVLLDAVIDTRVTAIGQLMWKRFCKPPDTSWTVTLPDFDLKSLYRNSESDHMATSDSYTESSLAAAALDESLSQQQDQPSAEELLEFSDPFFPQNSPKSEVSPSLIIPSQETNNNTLEAASGQIPADAPVTVPNLFTLRLIVRAATTDMKEREEAGLGFTDQRKQLAWAAKMFKAFGITDPTIIEQEIQYPLDEFDAEMLEAARKSEASELERKENLEVGAPVSSMWVPVA